MEDKGENIIFLAREILESNEPQVPVKQKSINVTMNFKTLCFTTFLAAASGSLISTCVQEQFRPLNHYEKVELQALMFYASRIKGINEELLRQQVGKELGVASFDELTAKDFSAARRFLQEKAL